MISGRHLLSIRIIILFYVFFPFYVVPNFFCILCNDASVHYSYATCSVDQTAKWAVGAFSHDFHICRHPSNFSCKYEHFNLISAVYRQLTSISSKPQDRIIYSSERVDSAVLRIGRTRLDSLLLFPISSVNIASRTHPPPPPPMYRTTTVKGGQHVCEGFFILSFRFSNSGRPLEPFCQSVPIIEVAAACFTVHGESSTYVYTYVKLVWAGDTETKACWHSLWTTTCPFPVFYCLSFLFPSFR